MSCIGARTDDEVGIDRQRAVLRIIGSWSMHDPTTTRRIANLVAELDRYVPKAVDMGNVSRRSYAGGLSAWGSGLFNFIDQYQILRRSTTEKYGCLSIRRRLTSLLSISRHQINIACQASSCATTTFNSWLIRRMCLACNLLFRIMIGRGLCNDRRFHIVCRSQHRRLPSFGAGMSVRELF